MMGGGSMGGGMGGGMGDSMGGGMGGPMGDGMGDPMMGGGDPGMGGMQVEQKPRPHHGWNGHFVIWSLGPKMHNLFVFPLAQLPLLQLLICLKDHLLLARR